MSTRPDEGGYQDERLPWLETVDEDYAQGPSFLRVLALIVLGLALVAAAIFGWYWWSNHRGSAVGNGELINAQEGDYKVKPEEAGGMNVQGEGDTAFATSEGAVTNGSVDLSKAPEEPVAGRRAPAPRPSASPGSSKVVAAVPASGSRLDAPGTGTPKASAPAPAHGGAASASGGIVQLGSFPSAAGANAAWAQLSKRFKYLAPLAKSVEPADVNGKTTYRLRVSAGSAALARDLCGRLKVAGESCYLPN